EKFVNCRAFARCSATSSNSWLRSTAVTCPAGPTRAATLIPGSPVPVARSSACIPGCGSAYATNAWVTPCPIAADLAFHFSAAIRRYDDPQCDLVSALMEGKYSGPLAPGNGCGSLACGRFQRGGLHLFRRLPQALEIVELARMLREHVHDEIYVIEQYPLRLAISLNVCGRKAGLLYKQLHFVGNG